MKEKSFAQELAALINRHGIDAKMNTNDWILADVAIDALNAYGKANQLREKMANAPEPGKDDCDCPACTLRRTLQGKAQPGGKEYRKPEAFDVPKEVEAMAAFFADMFPGSEIQIQRFDLKRIHGINAGQRTNKRTEKEGATMKDNCKNPCMMFANPNICFIWNERLREWRHTTADRIISGLMGNYQSAKA